MAHNKNTTAWLLSPRNHTGPNHEGYRKLLALVDGRRTAEQVLRAWNKVRGERAEFALKHSVQGDSLCGLPGVMDIPDHLYPKYRATLAAARLAR